jgi:hypothetical protein
VSTTSVPSLWRLTQLHVEVVGPWAMGGCPTIRRHKMCVPVRLEVDAVFVDALHEAYVPALLVFLPVPCARQQLLRAFVPDALRLGLGLSPERQKRESD